MEIGEALEKLMVLAKEDPHLRERILATRQSENALSSFCSIATEAGCPMTVMDLIEYGEQTYAAIKRSTNGGGENSPVLDGQDDEYTLFLSRLQ